MSQYAPANYVEARVNGKRRIVEVVKHQDGRITGYRANRDGSRWDHDDGATWTQEIIILPTANVDRWLKLDLTYGELVEVAA